MRLGEALSAEIVVRPCHRLDEFEACIELQKCVWASRDLDVVPLPLFVVAAETGGQVLGAFAGDKIVGFTLALAGVRDAKPYLHSHMTAVLEELRDRGVGRQLKLLQRRDALARAIGLVEWTFDPLELKNAYFNLARLGAIVRRLIPNCYGITSSPLHGGLPTDRLMAEWWLASPRVAKTLAGEKPTRSGQAAVIDVPASFARVKQTDVAEARRVQDRIREQFERWFARGYAATGFEVTADTGRYVLEPWAENQSRQSEVTQ